MRLYTRTGATTLDDPEFGHFDADEQGGFDLPEELSDRLHGFHVGGRPMWETDIERQRRLMSEELERRKDPATLLDAVEQIMRAAKASAAAPAKAAGQSEPAAPVEGAKAAASVEAEAAKESAKPEKPAEPAKPAKATRTRKAATSE